jgi:hypothetical protein
LLVDRGVVRVEGDEGCGTIGVTFEDSFGGRWDGKKEAELVRKGAGSEITKRKLESAVATLDVDLESDQGVLISCRSRRHDCYDQGVVFSALEIFEGSKSRGGKN